MLLFSKEQFTDYMLSYSSSSSSFQLYQLAPVYTCSSRCFPNSVKISPSV